MFRKDRQEEKGGAALLIKMTYTCSEAWYEVDGRPGENF